MQWDKFMVASDIEWNQFKTLDKKETGLGTYYFSTTIRTKLSKMEKGAPAKILVQQLSHRLLFAQHSEKPHEPIHERTFQMLVQAYRDCKMLKLVNYTYSSWSNQPKNFDGKTLLAVFEERLASNKAEMREFIRKSVEDSSTQCIWEALSHREGLQITTADHKYVVNSSMLRKFATLLLQDHELFDDFAVGLTDSLLMNI